jgi:hypothetical protein
VHNTVEEHEVACCIWLHNTVEEHEVACCIGGA